MTIDFSIGEKSKLNAFALLTSFATFLPLLIAIASGEFASKFALSSPSLGDSTTCNAQLLTTEPSLILPTSPPKLTAVAPSDAVTLIEELLAT